MTHRPPDMPEPATRARPISRREAVRRVSALFGGVLVGGPALLVAAEAARPRELVLEGVRFSQAAIELLDEVADTILPETDTPGAKAAGVGPFIALMVTDCYSPDEQAVFIGGLETIDARSFDQFGRAFADAAPHQRLALVETLDREQYDHMQTLAPGQAAHPFRMLKELTLLGYFTSEIGCTQAQRYIETPGRYDPCVPMEPGERTWARHA